MDTETPAHHWFWPAAGMSRTDRRRWLFAIGSYLLLVYVTQWILWFARDSSVAIRGAIGLIPILAIIHMIRLHLRFHRAQDELQRRIDAEAMVVAAFIVGLGSFALGLILASIGTKTVSVVWVFCIGPLLIGLTGFSKRFVARPYR